MSEDVDKTSPRYVQLGNMIVQKHEIYRQTVGYKQLLHELRSHSDLEGFSRLPPRDTSCLIECVPEEHFTIINKRIFRSDAIFVTANGVDLLPLPLRAVCGMKERDQWYNEALCLISTDPPVAT